MTRTTWAWIQAFFTVLVLWGLNNVLDIYSIRTLGVNPVIYSCAAFASSAFILIFYAGKGPLAKETIRSVDTWVFGSCVLLTYIVGLNLFSMVSATEGTLILRFSMVTATLGSWFFLSRKPSLLQLLGTLTVFVSIIIICEGTNHEVKPMVYTLMLLSAFLQTVRVFAAEFHRPHNQASKMTEDPKARCRVVGFIMFAVSTLFLLLTLVLAFIQNMGDNAFAIPSFPTLDDFFHAPSLLIGLLVGVVFIAPIRLLEFSSIQKINSENFLAVASLSFVATWFWEWAFQPLTGLDNKILSQQDMWAGFAITAGGLLFAFSKILQKAKPSPIENHLIYTPQNVELVEDSREIIANTLEHFQSDIKKSAEALKIPQAVIKAFIEDDEKVVSFKNFPEVARCYRKNVAMSDALTGLANRSAFMTAIKSAEYEVKTYSILYLDLDKFKPVNDTYGHEAGDKILQGVADRLKEAFPKRSVITRMGGDEYCVLLLDADSVEAKKQANILKEIISEPFTINSVKDKITIGASIGTATYPEDGDSPEELLSVADVGMYQNKNN